MYFDTSTTIPAPTTCPASEVPAVLGIREICSFLAKSINILISFSFLGLATAKGTSR